MGVAWGHGRVALVHLEGDGAGRQLAACTVLPDEPDGLRAWVKEQGLAGARCVLVPPDEECVLRVLEAPEVPEEERRESARWLVQDLLDFPAEEAWIDVLDIPVDAGWTRARKVVVVAGRPDALADRVEQVRQAGLAPVGFDVRERALLALADPGREQAGAAVIDLQPKAGLLVVGERGELHVTRPLGIDADSVGSEGAAEWNERGDPEAPADAVAPAFESLLLELQRSLDYVESEFGRGPIRRVVIAPSEAELSALGPYLEQHLRVQVEFLDLARCFPGEASPPTALQATCLAAAGGAAGRGSLFTHELQPKARSRSGRLDAQAVARLCAIVAVFGVAQFGFDQLQARRLRLDLEALEHSAEATRARLGELATAEALTAEDPIQKARVAALERKRRAQAGLLQHLAGDAGPGRSFAGVLTALAREPVGELWLTGIHLREGGRAVSLRGMAMRGERVPVLIDRLEAEATFDGVRFEGVALRRGEEPVDPLRFELQGATSGEAQP